MQFNQFQKNNKGSALIMVLAAAVGLAALSVAFINNKKMIMNNILRARMGSEVDEAMTRIISTFATPGGCNANLATKNVDGTSPFTQINICTSGTCVSGTGTPLFRLNDFRLNATDTNEGKIKIESVTYQVVALQSTNLGGVRFRPGTTKAMPAIVRVKVTFTKKLRTDSAGVVTSSKAGPFELEVPVVTSIWTNPNTLTDFPTILGCARSPASTNPYN